ncbi:hypothetical protein H8E88_02180 [candidate division KSB1 bacterium]|nr:hypothetical protein [candidate division KSB1 bacterium]MBL7094924.1 hypothetical protein [candidate division KSB1 bacterium]
MHSNRFLESYLIILLILLPQIILPQNWKINSNYWTATDALGRKTPNHSDVGSKKSGKYIAMFYWTWHTDNLADFSPVMNITEILKEYPEAAHDADHSAWKGIWGGVFWWDEPLFGYYRTTDEWVLRHHAEMLADAGVDVVFFDCTNGSFTWLKNPELISIMKNAGISDVWMGSFLQGKWYHTPKELRKSADFLLSKGFNPHVLTVPLGHPGNAIDPSDESWATKKQNWKNACDYDGSLFSGTSIHPPIVEENIEAHKLLANEGFDILFLDDDFRLAKYPGKIGGCFCDDCKNEFLNNYGYGNSDWEILIDSVAKRNPTKILRAWIEYTCDKEYDMFAALQNATPQMDIGIMVMYLGAEKAGIALDKYQDVPFRVGELMFGDKSFGKVKGKTDELFSSLFHRRFVKPEMAYSESTTYPQDALSAKNMAAKLSVSLLSDVRNTMFMSGIQPFPIDYWKTLAPAMKKNAQLHEEIAGLTSKGPFKHFWGWDSRLVGTDKPFSLFLASGIPFEVIDDVTKDGWI